MGKVVDIFSPSFDSIIFINNILVVDGLVSGRGSRGPVAEFAGFRF
jgi:hypothetical protein